MLGTLRSGVSSGTMLGRLHGGVTYSVRQAVRRRYCSAQPTKKRSAGSRPTAQELLHEHVAHEPAEVQTLLATYSKQLLKRRREPEQFYIVHDSLAGRLVEQLGPVGQTPHLEIGPGPGVLTRHLLAAGVTRLTCCEPTTVFREALRLQVLPNFDAARVQVLPLNFLRLSKIHGAALHGNDAKLKKLTADIVRRDWEDEPCVRVVGVAHRCVFFQFLVRSIIHREHLFQLGRPEFLVYVPEHEVQRMTAVPHDGGRLYRPYSILSQLLFQVELLDRAPAKQFYPWMSPKKRSSPTDASMVLIRYTPRVDPGVPPSEFASLDFFVRHCAIAKRRRIIPQFEEWVPGCGPRLIRLGHGVFSTFRELEPAQLRALFHEFCSWPEYRACSFHAAVQQSLHETDSVAEAEVDMEHLAAEVEVEVEDEEED